MFRLTVIFFVVLSLTACSNSTKRRNTPYLSTNSSVPFRFKPALPTTNEGKLPAAPMPLANQLPVPTNNPGAVTVSTNSTTTTVNTATTSVGVNPAHGQPGHRCDISVGAPLNSVAAAASSGSNTTTITPATNQLATASSTPTLPAASQVNQAAEKNVKLNPAHGQPGHDCSIVVGQPLKK